MFIVTGGAGLIGSAIIWELNRRGVDDILVVDNLASTEKWKNLVRLPRPAGGGGPGAAYPQLRFQRQHTPLG